MPRTSNTSSSHSRLTAHEVTALIVNLFSSKKHEKIVDFQLQPFSTETLGFLGTHELLSVVVHDDSSSKKTRTVTFFVKSVAPGGKAFDRSLILDESMFYGVVLPELLRGCKDEPWAAKCHLIKDDLLVLEDLKSLGFKVITDPPSDGQLRSAVVSLARFHASSILLEEKLQRPLNDVYPGFFRKKVFIEDDGGCVWKWILTGVEVVEAVAKNLGMEPKHAWNAYNLSREMIKPVQGRRNVLCHCDLWSNNMMFKNEDDGMTIRCRLVDFQLLGYTSYAADLVQLLHLNATISVRQRLERELVELYHSALVESLRRHGLDDSRIIGLEEVFRDLEEKRIWGLVNAAQYFPITLLNKDLSAEYTKDVEKMAVYMYTSRKDFVLRAMSLDVSYRGRVEESVKELIGFMQNINQ